MDGADVKVEEVRSVRHFAMAVMDSDPPIYSCACGFVSQSDEIDLLAHLESALVALLHLTYVGPIRALFLEKALVTPAIGAGTGARHLRPLDKRPGARVFAQFDKLGLTLDEVDLSHDWHEFRRSDFR